MRKGLYSLLCHLLVDAKCDCKDRKVAKFFMLSYEAPHKEGLIMKYSFAAAVLSLLVGFQAQAESVVNKI